MDYYAILSEAFVGIWHLVKIAVLVLLPLLVLLEFASEVNLFRKVADAGERILRRFSLTRASTFPLLMGAFLGLICGAGILITSSRDGTINKREMNIVCIFLGLCHAVIEDNIIFIMIGANWAWIIFSRLVVAIIAMYIFSRYAKA